MSFRNCAYDDLPQGVQDADDAEEASGLARVVLEVGLVVVVEVDVHHVVPGVQDEVGQGENQIRSGHELLPYFETVTQTCKN